MKQPILSQTWDDIGTDYIIPIWSSRNTNQAFGASKEHLIAIVWPTPGNFNNMLITGDDDGAIWTLYKDDVATAITAVSSGGVAVDLTHSVTAVLGSRFYYRRQGVARVAASSTPLNTNIEFNSDTAFISAYGFAACPSAGSGGSLGSNGLAGAAPNSNTLSLCPIDGDVTRNVVFAWFSAVDVTKGVRATIWKNGVAQDGTAGTPDTRIELFATAANTPLFASVATALVAAEGNRLETNIELINAPGIHSMGASTEFTADVAGEFALCGSNATSQGPGGPYTDLSVFGSLPSWWGTDENVVLGAHNTGAVTTFSITKLQWFYIGAYPAGTGPVVFKVVKNGLDPANQPTITVVTNDTYIADSDATHIVQISMGDTWSLNAVPFATGSVQAHWSFAGSFSLTPTPPSGEGSGGGIYQLVPNKRDDTYYESFIPLVTQDYKIP